MNLSTTNYSGFNVYINKKPLLTNNLAINASSALNSNGIKKNGNFYSLSFTGNPNHILLISCECKPYAKAGGMGDVNGELPENYNKNNKGKFGKDEIRVMMPLYNSPDGPVKKGKNLYFVSADGKEFPLQRTGIKTEFAYGLNKSTAVLYKAKNPENGVITYFVYSPEISKNKREYTGSHIDIYADNSAFSAACVALIKKLKGKEKFDTGVLNTTDWHTAFAIHDLHEAQKKDKALQGIKTVHTFHNAGYQGDIEPFQAVINNFKPQEVATILKNKNIYDKDEIVKLFPEKPWDIHWQYNPTLQAIKEADLLTTVSDGYRQELISSEKIAPKIRHDLEKNKHKLVGIPNGVDAGVFAPSRAKSPFDITNFETEKVKNKLYVQEDLSLNGKKELLSNINKEHIEGHLDINPDAMLCVMGSRFDVEQKGFDILMKSSEKFLNENKNIQLIVGGPGFPENSDLVNNFRENVIKKHQGRVVLVTSYLPNPKLFSAADAVLAPSRFEPCGLVQLQAMIGGTIPILSNTGGHIDTVISAEENPNKATGFKTAKSFYDTANPEEEFAKTIGKAYKTFTSDKKIWNKMIKNAMEYDSSWDKSVKSYYRNVYHNPLIDKRAETGKTLAYSA